MKIDYICKHCGSNEVERSATVTWSFLEQKWLISHVYDEEYCLSCDNTTHTKKTEIKEVSHA